MCKECDWSEEEGINPLIRQKCDCGNFKWQRTLLKVDEPDLKPSMQVLYRCTKCDTLMLAQHLLHRVAISGA